MATTPKTKKPAKQQVSTTKSKGVVASKKKGLSGTQWGLIAIGGVLVLTIAGYFAVQQYENSTSSAASCVSKTFKKGSKSACVGYFQAMINGITKVLDYKQVSAQDKKYYKYDGRYFTGPQIAVDNTFGSGTEERVKAFQTFSHLNGNLSVDGIIGPKTWTEVCEWAYWIYPYNGSGNYANIVNKAYEAYKNAGCTAKMYK